MSRERYNYNMQKRSKFDLPIVWKEIASFLCHEDQYLWLMTAIWNTAIDPGISWLDDWAPSYAGLVLLGVCRRGVNADISPSELTEYVQLYKWLQAWWKSWWLTSLSTLPSEILSLKQKLAASTFQGCHPFDQPMVNWWFGLGFKLEEGLFAYCTITIGTRNPNHQPKPSNHRSSIARNLHALLWQERGGMVRASAISVRTGPEGLVVLVTQL